MKDETQTATTKMIVSEAAFTSIGADTVRVKAYGNLVPPDDRRRKGARRVDLLHPPSR
jgi:hypothetical protein